jgi:Uncharacterized protein conserved in bacteria
MSGSLRHSRKFATDSRPSRLTSRDVTTSTEFISTGFVIPGDAWSYDSASRRQFGMDPATHQAEWKAFRTNLVSEMVKEAYDSIQSVKPGMVMSAAVWGVYNDKWAWHTLAGATNLMQDSRAWAKGGYMDVLVPMTYYRIGPSYCSRIDWKCTPR